MNRRTMLASSTALPAGVLRAALTGCELPASWPGGAPARKGPVTLELWDRDDPLYVKFVEAWLPLIKVDYIPTGLTNDDKFIAAMAGGTPPDVVLMNGRRPRNHFEAGRVLALDSFVKASRLDVEDFFQGVYKHLSAGGGLDADRGLHPQRG